jgi:ABC-type amino acid transport substrate-binding protein
LVALLAGCADLAGLIPSGEAKEQAVGTGAFVAPVVEATLPPQMSTAARILARGAIVVGVRYDLEPFSYITADSQLAGMEIDLAHELARRWLGSAEAVRFRQVRSDTAYQYLAEGTVDVVFAGLVHTQEAQARADFSPAYFADGMALLTFPDTGIQELGQLSEKRVGIVSWTDSGEALAASASVTPTSVVYDHYFDVIDALRLREIDAYADQRHRLERARRIITGSTIVGQWTQEPVAMIFRQDDPFFYNLVQLTFQDMGADGARDALYARWLPGTSPPSLPVVPGNAPTPQLTQSPQQISTLDVVARVRDRRVLTVGYFTDRWPYSADRADGVPTGFSLRLVERIAELWLGSVSAVSFVPMTSEQDARQRLERGDVDMLAGTWVHTRDAELGFDFSIPYLDDGVSIMSRASEAFSDLGQLGGQPVGVVAGSAAEAAVPSLSQGTGLSAVGYPSFADALAALQGGEVVALLTERQPALAVHFREEGFSVSDRRYTTRPVAFMLPEGDSDFRDLVSITLMALEAQGIYQELYSLWFDDAVPRLQSLPGHAATSLSVGQ